jgi:hypothetical protein
MSESSRLAAKRYRQYLINEQKEYLIRQLASLILRILEVFARTIGDSGITGKERRRVQKINVE